MTTAASIARRGTVLLGLVAFLAGCAAAPGTAPPAPSGGLAGILEAVRESPEDRLAAQVACQLSLGQRSDAFAYRGFFAGFFDLPEEDTRAAFCAAIVEAVIADDLTRADLAAFAVPAEQRGRAPLGTLLRKLIDAHERLHSQEAGVPPSRHSRRLSMKQAEALH
ncbi:MAG: hypothetical protein ACFCUW_06885 [Kiloniellaceae bacterium]